jgi:hypothetical protein
VNSGAKERLIDINITEAGDHSLVEKGILDLSGAPGENLLDSPGGKSMREWLWTKTGVEAIDIGLPGDDDPAEFPLVAKSKIGSAIQVDGQVFEAHRLGARWNEQEATGHPEVDDQVQSLVQMDGEVLATATRVHNRATNQGTGWIGSLKGGFQDPGERTRCDADNPGAHNRQAHHAPDCLDFWKLWHTFDS